MLRGGHWWRLGRRLLDSWLAVGNHRTSVDVLVLCKVGRVRRGDGRRWCWRLLRILVAGGRGRRVVEVIVRLLLCGLLFVSITSGQREAQVWNPGNSGLPWPWNSWFPSSSAQAYWQPVG